MIWLLVGVGALYVSLGQILEAITLLIAIVPFIGMDAYLHRRTQASMEGLKKRMAASATVVRDGGEKLVPASELVVGDLVLVSTGQFFPADGILLAGNSLQAEESSLTGEAFPVRKESITVPLETAEPMIDASHWGFAGTRLLTGSATLRIVFTGAETLYGEIIALARQGAKARTPLQAAMMSLLAVLVAVAGVICLILAFVRWRQGYGWMDALVSAATLAVAAIPEEFPVAFTFFLGAGAYRLAQRQALVRRAVSVENIGRVSVICSDKTGTITEGRVRVAQVIPAAGESEDSLLRIAALSSRKETGDPVDAAILEEADRRLVRINDVARLATYPFTEERRRESAVVEAFDGARMAVTKGSPEVLLASSSQDEGSQAEWSLRVALLAGEGYRVLACAWRELEGKSWIGEPDRGLHFAGLIVLEDPVRDGVPQAVSACRQAGIHVLMVTGDHPATTHAVARQIGLGGANPVVIGAQEARRRLDGGQSLGTVDAIARAVPSEKLAIVTALQKSGEVVAVTGDGVNDVPALQAADVGIAMGERATRSAREVAAIVLLDDNFRTIVGAIAEGRQLFRNLKASFQYLLSIHTPLVITAALIPLAGYPLLYLPIHIVWLELIIHPTALLVFQGGASSDRLEPAERPERARFFSGVEWLLTAVTGLLITLVLVFGYDRSLGAAHDVEHARAMALVSLSVASASIAAALSRLKTVVSRGICAGTLALAVLLVQIPVIAAALHLAPLHADDWAWAIAGGLLGCLPIGIGRAIHRLKHQRLVARTSPDIESPAHLLRGAEPSEQRFPPSAPQRHQP